MEILEIVLSLFSVVLMALEIGILIGMQKM